MCLLFSYLPFIVIKTQGRKKEQAHTQNPEEIAFFSFFGQLLKQSKWKQDKPCRKNVAWLSQPWTWLAACKYLACHTEIVLWGYTKNLAKTKTKPQNKEFIQKQKLMEREKSIKSLTSEHSRDQAMSLGSFVSSDRKKMVNPLHSF